MSLSNTLINSLLDAIFNATAYSVAQVYVSLHTANPGTTGANEATGGSYARQAGSWGAASGGSISNDTAINFTSMPASTITHVGLWTASSGGTFLWGGALTVSRTLSAGATAQFTIAALVNNFN